MNLSKSLLITGAALALTVTGCKKEKTMAITDPTAAKISKENQHYTFELNENVIRTKVTFRNHFGIELAADLYTPEEVLKQVQDGKAEKLPAIAISGPFGAVKEQSSGFYANQMASRGYIALAFDPSFTGESGGEPRYMNSPDINTEDFMAAVDFLSTRENVDPEKIGIIGICGWGGMALNTAAIDTRIKATVASTMYDMSRVTANGYFDSANNAEARHRPARLLWPSASKILRQYRLAVLISLVAEL